jgi:hypothetical protein
MCFRGGARDGKALIFAESETPRNGDECYRSFTVIWNPITRLGFAHFDRHLVSDRK